MMKYVLKVVASVGPYPLTNVARADDVRPSLERDALLAAAPAVEDDRFAVPRIVAEES
jgi:aspartyl-tRNA(Asn)/glutamyl-tRNA(Gln) amidotransferase subunit C